MRSQEVHLIERPQAIPGPEQFKRVEVNLPDPRDGEVLVEKPLRFS